MTTPQSPDSPLDIARVIVAGGDGTAHDYFDLYRNAKAVARAYIERMEPVEIENRIGTEPTMGSVGTPHRCPKCDGYPLYVTGKFCPNCGVPLSWKGK